MSQKVLYSVGVGLSMLVSTIGFLLSSIQVSSQLLELQKAERKRQKKKSQPPCICKWCCTLLQQSYNRVAQPYEEFLCIKLFDSGLHEARPTSTQLKAMGGDTSSSCKLIYFSLIKQCGTILNTLHKSFFLTRNPYAYSINF